MSCASPVLWPLLDVSPVPTINTAVYWEENSHIKQSRLQLVRNRKTKPPMMGLHLESLLWSLMKLKVIASYRSLPQFLIVAHLLRLIRSAITRVMISRGCKSPDVLQNVMAASLNGGSSGGSSTKTYVQFCLTDFCNFGNGSTLSYWHIIGSI